MRLRYLGMGLFAALILCLPLTAADTTKKDKDKKDDPALTPIDSDKLPFGDYTGTLLTTPTTDGGFTLQVDTKYYVPKNPDQLSAKEAKLQVQIQAAQQKMLATQASLASATKQKEITKYQNQLATETTHYQQLLAQSQIKPSDLKEMIDTKVYDMKLQDKADIRYMNLPQVFDDDGKVKKYSDAEIKELKGKKTNLPGYEGKVDDLKVGQIVKVTLIYVAPKPKPKDPPATDKADPKADPKPDDAKKVDPKDPADKPPPEKKMWVKMVVILQDAPMDDSTDPKNKKKKDK